MGLSKLGCKIPARVIEVRPPRPGANPQDLISTDGRASQPIPAQERCAIFCIRPDWFCNSASSFLYARAFLGACHVAHMATLQYSLPGSSDVHTAKVDAPKSKTSCGILLGHGAGGDSNSGHLPKIAQAFSDANILCIRFNCKPPNLAKRVAHAKVKCTSTVQGERHACL